MRDLMQNWFYEYFASSFYQNIIIEVQLELNNSVSNSKDIFVDIPKPQTTPTTPKADTSSEMQVNNLFPKLAWNVK